MGTNMNNAVCKVEPAILSKGEVGAIAKASQVPAGIPKGIAVMFQVRGMLKESVGKVEVLPALQVWEHGPAETREAMQKVALRMVDEIIEHLRVNNYWPAGRK